jgi:large-conductance mechanosensitive channel
MGKVAKVALGFLILGAYVFIIAKLIQKFDRRGQLAIAMEDAIEDRVSPFIWLVAFVGTLLEIGDIVGE